jgi:hypothetical protein
MDDFVHVTIIMKDGNKTSTVTIPKARAVSSSVEYDEDDPFWPSILTLQKPRRVKTISFDIDGPEVDKDGMYGYLEEK